MKLLVSDFEVTLPNNDDKFNGGRMSSEFFVKLIGPVDSPYEGVSTLDKNFKYREYG